MATTTPAPPAPPPAPPASPAGTGPVAAPWRPPVAVGALAVAGTAAVVVLDPTANHVPLCPLAFATGLDCPLCGSLRAVHALTGGDVATALDHNLLVTASIPVLVVAWAVWTARSLGAPVPARWRWPAATGPILAVVALAFAVARNLPALAWLGSGATP